MEKFGEGQIMLVASVSGKKGNPRMEGILLLRTELQALVKEVATESATKRH